MAKVEPQDSTGAVRPEFRSATTPDGDDLQAQISKLRGDVETLTTMLKDAAESKISAARAEAGRKAGQASSEVQRQAQQLADMAGHYHSEAETAVKNNPGAALGIATGFGFLAGLLLARR